MSSGFVASGPLISSHVTVDPSTVTPTSSGFAMWHGHGGGTNRDPDPSPATSRWTVTPVPKYAAAFARTNAANASAPVWSSKASDLLTTRLRWRDSPWNVRCLPSRYPQPVSFDEFAIASFLAPSGRPTYPVFLYAGSRTPGLLPELIAIGSIVILTSLVVIVVAEGGRRWAERRLQGNATDERRPEALEPVLP